MIASASTLTPALPIEVAGDPDAIPVPRVACEIVAALLLDVVDREDAAAARQLSDPGRPPA